MSNFNPNHFFFGSLCNADDKMEAIAAFHNQMRDLVLKEKSNFKEVEIEYEDDPELYDKKFHLNFTLESQIRNSTVTSLITFLEIELQQFCITVQRSLALQVSYNDLKGTTLDQFKTYTNKIGELNIDFSADTWQSIKELVELRNCIVHYDAQIEDWYGRKFSRTKSIENLSQKFNFIHIKDSGYIELTDEAGSKCISIVKDFIDLIYKAALKRFPKNE